MCTSNTKDLFEATSQICLRIHCSERIKAGDVVELLLIFMKIFHKTFQKRTSTIWIWIIHIKCLKNTEHIFLGLLSRSSNVFFFADAITAVTYVCLYYHVYFGGVLLCLNIKCLKKTMRADIKPLCEWETSGMENFSGYAGMFVLIYFYGKVYYYCCKTLISAGLLVYTGFLNSSRFFPRILSF